MPLDSKSTASQATIMLKQMAKMDPIGWTGIGVT